MKTPYLLATDVTKSYAGQPQPAIENISLQLQPGEILGLLGPNGAGKTTFIRCVSQLLLPDVGDIQIHGRLGVLLEGARSSYWKLTPRQNLSYFGALQGLSGKQLQQRVTELTNWLKLPDREVQQLSTGMKQKLGIAIALLHEPDILLLDEPTLGLDVAIAREVEQEIQQLAKEQGKGILITTHSMDMVERLADTVAIIKRRLLAYKPTRALISQFTRQHVVEVILPIPITPQETTFVIPDIHSERLSSGGTILRWQEDVSGNNQQLVTILQQLDERGYPVTSIQKRPLTLEEVFIQLTHEA